MILEEKVKAKGKGNGKANEYIWMATPDWSACHSRNCPFESLWSTAQVADGLTIRIEIEIENLIHDLPSSLFSLKTLETFSTSYYYSNFLFACQSIHFVYIYIYLWCWFWGSLDFRCSFKIFTKKSFMFLTFQKNILVWFNISTKPSWWYCNKLKFEIKREREREKAIHWPYKSQDDPPTARLGKLRAHINWSLNCNAWVLTVNSRLEWTKRHLVSMSWMSKEFSRVDKQGE